MGDNIFPGQDCFVCDLVSSFWVVFSWWVSFLILFAGCAKGGRLKSISHLKIENRVLLEAGIYSVKLERILPLDLVSAVLYPIVREDLFEKQGPDRSFLIKNPNTICSMGGLNF